MITLRAARALIDGTEEHDVYVTIDGPFITGADSRPATMTPILDLGPVDLIPGLIDLHSDCLEERAHPRPGREQPLPAAMLQLDAEAAAHGITTNYVCATIEDDPLQHRSTTRAIETVRCLASWRKHMRIDERIHLRVELTSSAFDTARELASRGIVGLISYMHHTPGYGQFAKSQDAWREIYANGFQGSERELQDLIADRRRRAAHATERRADVARIAAQTGTRLVSHDDETAADVQSAAQLGVRISEFPLTADAASNAHSLGLGIVMGAPNAWHGGSHLGGLAVRDVLRSGHLTALASDYHPPSLLAAAYALVGDQAAPWQDALALVTSNPARLAGLADRGTIAPGKRADLVAVEVVDSQPIVRHLWTAGTPVLGTIVDRSDPYEQRSSRDTRPSESPPPRAITSG